MLETVYLKLSEIYVPVKMRKKLDADKVLLLAEKLIEDGELVPIKVRRGKDRYVLVSGLNRLEAANELGEQTIGAMIVHAQIY